MAFLQQRRYDCSMIRSFFDKRGDTQLERYFIPVVVVGVLIAMGISLSIGLSQSVWFDEAYSIIIAKQPVSELVRLASVDTHPPLYYLLLKGWATLFGWSELALRSLSVTAMGGAMAMGALLVRRLFDIRATLITLPFIVFAPFLLRYGFEIRMYALASFIGVAATYILVRALQAKDNQEKLRLYLIYTLLVAMGVYTLYYTVLLWLAHFAWLFWNTRKEKMPILKSPWFVAFCGSAALFLPWLPTFISQIGNGALAAISQPLTIDNMVGIVSFMFVYQPNWQLSALMSLLVLFVIIAIGILTAKAWRNADKGQRANLLLIIAYVMVPIVILTLVSLVKPMYVERYLSHILIAGSMFVGVVVALALAKKPSRNLIMLCSGLLATMLIGVIQLAQVGNYNFQRLQSPAVKELASTINCDRGTTIFAADPYVAIELDYYLSSCQIRFYSETVSLGGGYAPLSNNTLHVFDPAKELANSRKVVYVYYDTQKLAIPSALRESSSVSFGSLHAATFSAEK